MAGNLGRYLAAALLSDAGEICQFPLVARHRGVDLQPLPFYLVEPADLVNRPTLRQAIGMLFAPLIRPYDTKSSVTTNASTGFGTSNGCGYFTAMSMARSMYIRDARSGVH
jgi:hypothetical protein